MLLHLQFENFTLSFPPRCSLSNKQQLNPAFLPHFYRFLGYNRFHLLMHVLASPPAPWFGAVVVTGGHPWFANPAAIRCHRTPGGFLGCLLDSYVHVWFVPGSVSRFSRSTGAVKPPQKRATRAAPCFLCFFLHSLYESLGKAAGFWGDTRHPLPTGTVAWGGLAAHWWRG